MTVQEFKDLQAKATEELKMPDKMSEIIDKNNLLPTFISDWQKLYANQTYILFCKQRKLCKAGRTSPQLPQMFCATCEHQTTSPCFCYANDAPYRRLRKANTVPNA